MELSKIDLENFKNKIKEILIQNNSPIQEEDLNSLTNTIMI